MEIAYLIDPDQDVLNRTLKGLEQKVAGKFTCKGVADVREALNDKNLDAISVAAPNHWHSLMTIWAAQAGKHVYVEKPMSHDIAEGPRRLGGPEEIQGRGPARHAEPQQCRERRLAPGATQRGAAAVDGPSGPDVIRRPRRRQKGSGPPFPPLARQQAEDHLAQHRDAID